MINIPKRTIKEVVTSGECYDPWITLKKFLTAYGTSLVGIILPYSIQFIQDYEWPPEAIIYIPLLIAALSAIQNIWKHWNDGKDTDKESCDPCVET